MSRDSLGRVPYCEAVSRAVGCPAVECLGSTNAIWLTSEGERAGSTVVGGRTVKGGWRGVVSSDGHFDNR